MEVWNCSSYLIWEAVGLQDVLCYSCPGFSSTHGKMLFFQRSSFKLECSESTNDPASLSFWVFSLRDVKDKCPFFFFLFLISTVFFRKYRSLSPRILSQCCVLAKTKTPKWKKWGFDNHLLRKWNRSYRSSNQWAKLIPCPLKWL